jgi:hypothetical protein
MGAPPTLRCTGSSRLRQLLKLLSLRRNRLLLINRMERLPFNCPSCTFTLSCRLYGALDCRELQCSLLLCLAPLVESCPPREHLGSPTVFSQTDFHSHFHRVFCDFRISRFFKAVFLVNYTFSVLMTNDLTWTKNVTKKLTSICQKTGQNVTILDKVISEVGISEFCCARERHGCCVMPPWSVALRK